MANKNYTQKSMFENGEDLPLFTGTAQKAEESTFSPTPTATTPSLPGLEPTFDELAAGQKAAHLKNLKHIATHRASLNMDGLLALIAKLEAEEEDLPLLGSENLDPDTTWIEELESRMVSLAKDMAAAKIERINIELGLLNGSVARAEAREMSLGRKYASVASHLSMAEKAITGAQVSVPRNCTWD